MFSPLSNEQEQNRQKYLCGILDQSFAEGASYSHLGLPLFHTCKGEEFRSIFNSKRLDPMHCNIFDEELIYLFYGRPAYRLKSAGKTYRDVGRFPVCFILRNNLNGNVKRVFPFDTGALVNKVFADVCGEETNPAKFQIGNDLNVVKKFISLIYQSDQKYFYATPTMNRSEIKSFSFELQQIYNLITESSEKNWDGRGYTIEVQCDHFIAFDRNRIEAIVLPSSYMNDQELADFLFNDDIEPIVYSVERSDPAAVTALIYGRVEEYLKGSGVI